jgi:transcriptional regulator with XRE-family HTH domain
MCSEAFGARLHAACLAAGASPERVAEEVEVSTATVYRWLSSVEPPSIAAQKMMLLSDFLCISGRYLLGVEKLPTRRISLLPDEQFLIERFRNLPEASRTRIVCTILDEFPPTTLYGSHSHEK